MKRIGLIALLCLLNSVSVTADDFSDTKALAEQGYADAQYNLAIKYDKGEGVAQDYTEAVKWYRKAAGQGLAEAQFNLANMLAKGEGVPQDYAEAVKWYRKAAGQGRLPLSFGLTGAIDLDPSSCRKCSYPRLKMSKAGV